MSFLEIVRNLPLWGALGLVPAKDDLGIDHMWQTCSKMTSGGLMSLTVTKYCFQLPYSPCTHCLVSQMHSSTGESYAPGLCLRLTPSSQLETIVSSYF